MERALSMLKKYQIFATGRAHLLARVGPRSVRKRCDKATTATSISEQNRQRAIKYLQEQGAQTINSRFEIVEKEANLKIKTSSTTADEEGQEELADTAELSDEITRGEERREDARIEAKKRILKYIPHVTGIIPDVKTLCTMLEAEHGGRNVVAIDVSNKASFANWIIVTTGLSVSHVIAIADGVQKDMRAAGVRVGGNDVTLCGRDAGDWIAIDVGGVVIHVMTEDTREHYDIETLWRSEVIEGEADQENKEESDAGKNRNRDEQ